jgi:hypothetical protein
MISGSAHKITDIIGGNILTGIANAGCVRETNLIEITPLDTNHSPDRFHLLHPRNHAQ